MIKHHQHLIEVHARSCALDANNLGHRPRMIDDVRNEDSEDGVRLAVRLWL